MDTTILLKKLNDWVGTKDIDYLSEDTGLSVCFKLLVPKLMMENEEVTIALLCPIGGCNWVVSITCHQHILAGDSSKTPAFALCLAIEKLIDSECDN